METEIKITKIELKKISLKFRTIASRLATTSSSEGKGNLKRFLTYIESNKIINEFITKHNKYEFEYSFYDDLFNCGYTIPDDSISKEISFIYQLLQNAVENNLHYSDLAQGYRYSASSRKNPLEILSKNVILPFVNHIEGYLSNLLIDMGENEQAKISIQVYGDNHGDHLVNSMSEIHIDQSNSSMGMGIVNQSTVEVDSITGKINSSSDVSEILQLVEILKHNLDNIPSENRDVVNDNIEIIESEIKNPTKISKLKSALIVLWSIGNNIAGFANAVSAIAERYNIPLLGLNLPVS